MTTGHLDRRPVVPRRDEANPRLTSGGVAPSGDFGSTVFRFPGGLKCPLDFVRLLLVPSDLVFEMLFQSRRRGFRPQPSGSCRRSTVISRRWMFQFLSHRMPSSNPATPEDPRAVPALQRWALPHSQQHLQCSHGVRCNPALPRRRLILTWNHRRLSRPWSSRTIGDKGAGCESASNEGPHADFRTSTWY